MANLNRQRLTRPAGLLLGSAVVLLLVAWGIKAVTTAWQVALANTSASATFRIRDAILNYHTAFGCLPISDPNHSWRLVLDQHERLGITELPFSFDEPWDSEYNRRIAAGQSVCGFDLLHRNKYVGEVAPTGFFAVVDDETAFAPNKTIRFDDIKDGLDNTVLVIEVAGSELPWSAPGDISLDELTAICSGNHQLSFEVHANGSTWIFADGNRFDVNKLPPAEVVRGLFTIDGGEKTKRKDLVKAGYPRLKEEP